VYSYLWKSISQLRDHTVLPATRHKRTHPAFTPARQAGTRETVILFVTLLVISLPYAGLQKLLLQHPTCGIPTTEQ